MQLENGEPNTEVAQHNRAERRAALGGSKKYGWRVNEWRAAAGGFSRAFTYLLIARGEIDSVTVGRARIITTHPADYLDSKR
jgi:hypothetical protein